MLTRGTVIIELPESVEANVIGYLYFPDDPSVTNDLVLSTWDAYITEWAQTLTTVLSTLVTVARVIVYTVDLLDGTGILVGDADISEAGTSVNEMAPHGVAVKTNFKVTGRARPSSYYLPGMNVATLTSGGLFNPTAMSVFATAALSWIADQPIPTTALSAFSVYWSQKDLQYFPLGGSVVQLNDIPDYQRRRKPGVGS